LTNEPSPAISTHHASPSGIPGQPRISSAEHASQRLEHTVRNANAMANNQGIQSPDNTYIATTLHQTTHGTSESRQTVSHLQPQYATIRTTLNGPTPSPTGKRPADPSVTAPQQHKRLRQDSAQFNLPCELPTQNDPNTLREWGRKIEERVTSCGGWAHLLRFTEGHRYRYLMNACVENDMFYLYLHQVFCLWSRDTSLVHALFHTLSPEIINGTFEVLLQVLRPNSSMFLDSLIWFSDFPTAKPPALPQPITLLIEAFIRAMFDKWKSLMASVRDRGFPVTAFEAVDSLKCRSTMLQNLLFVVSRRTIGIPDRFSRDLDLLFHEDQRLEASFLATPTPVNHAMEARSAVCGQYLSASREARKQASAQGM
jgi:zinc finger MIZ domain-containing protein